MLSLKRLRQSKAARNAAASYFSFFSIAAVAFLSIPIAVHFLKPEEIGLWTVVNQIVSYLLWLDLGIGGAIGRKIANAIAQDDVDEINQWWTASRFALTIQGGLVLVLGLTIAPFAIELFKVPEVLRNETRILLAGSIVITAISFPLKGVPGLMTAQERFHWIPLIQGTAPWISLGAFAFLLNRGLGIQSYLWGMALSLVGTWIAFTILINTGAHRPHWDRRGLRGDRFRSLFGFSLNLSGISLVNSVINSIPAMIISRSGNIGGLAVVPQYNFTSRGPVMISNLVQRMGFAFYPRLQRLYVEQERDKFGAKFIQVGIITIGFGLIAAGVVIAGNRMLVEILAGPDFYAGHYMTLWLAIGMILTPFAWMFQCLRQIAGSMGKTVAFSILKLAVAMAASIPCYHHFGLAGLAAVFMLAPLVDATYGYFQGAKSCGFSPAKLSLPIALHALAAVSITAVAGYIAANHSQTGLLVYLRGKPIHLPDLFEAGCGATLVLIGLSLGTYQMIHGKRDTNR